MSAWKGGVLFTLLLCLPAGAGEHLARGRKGALVSIHPLASAAGLEMLQAGGNAVDAAVATGFALAVVHPAAGNLGGGGFLVAALPGPGLVALDFRETAPAAAHRTMFLDEEGRPRRQASLVGPLAAGVPGTPAGLLYALEKWGTLPREKVMTPALRLARQGFVVGPSLNRSLARRSVRRAMARFPASRALFYPEGRPLAAEATLVQPDLARTLERIAEKGREGFYAGETARCIVAACRRHGGIITPADLAGYRPRLRKPLAMTWRGHQVVTMPPPSSGGVCLCQMLALVDADLPRPGAGVPFVSAAKVDLLARAMRLAFADRAAWLGDPDFFPLPLAGLVAEDYLARRARLLAPGKPLVPVGPGRPPGAERIEPSRGGGPAEGDQTTHYVAVDRAGGCVSLTTTLNSSFGAKVVVAGAGFLLNNEMDDFSVAPGTPNQFGLVGGEANAIEPGKRMLSSMSPTLVRREGKVVLALGSPGGPRIINTVFQVIVNRIGLGMDLRWAINNPRFHQQWRPRSLYLEENCFCPEIKEKLSALGWRLQAIPAVGRCQAIGREEGGWWCALSDLRGEGGALAH